MKMQGGRGGTRTVGVTLIEFLVFLAILVVLFIALMPSVPPNVVPAKYATAGIPQVGNIRTKVALYAHEYGYLPGLHRYTDGTVIRATNGPPTRAYGNSVLLPDDPLPEPETPALPAATRLYGQCMNRDGNRYAQQMAAVSANETWRDIWVPVTNHQFVNHYAEDLDISDADLMGRYCRPENFVYAAPVGKYEGKKYMYLVAVLGDGEKLPSGTGYAVLECYNPVNSKNRKVVAIWKRWKGEYKSMLCTSDQLVLCYYGADTGIAAPDLKTDAGKQSMANHIFIPLDLASDDQAKISQAMEDLRLLGWGL
jgi:hypothetical protein